MTSFLKDKNEKLWGRSNSVSDLRLIDCTSEYCQKRAWQQKGNIRIEEQVLTCLFDTLCYRLCSYNFFTKMPEVYWFCSFLFQLIVLWLEFADIELFEWVYKERRQTWLPWRMTLFDEHRHQKAASQIRFTLIETVYAFQELIQIVVLDYSHLLTSSWNYQSEM